MARWVDSVQARLPWLVALVFVAPVLLVHYPPMTDLPLHEVPISVVRHWGDTAMWPPGLYHRNFGHPNQLFHLVTIGLAWVMPLRLACKVAVALAVASVPLGAGRLARHLSAHPATVLLVAPLAMGWMFYWGLVANIVGLGILLAVLPDLDGHASAPTLRRGAHVTLALFLLYMAHEAMLITACGALLALLVVAPPPAGAAAPPLGERGKRLLLQLGPIALLALGAILQLKLQDSLRAGDAKNDAVRFNHLYVKVLAAPGVVFGGHDELVRDGLFLVAAGAMVAFVVGRSPPDARRSPAPSPRTLVAFRDLAHAYRFELLGLGLVGVYLAAPATLNGATLLHYRFLPAAYGLLAIASAARLRPDHAGARVGRLLAAVPAVGALGLALPIFADAHRVHTDLETLMGHVAPGSAVLQATAGTAPRRLFSVWTASARIVATRGGRALADFTMSSVAPAVRDPAMRWEAIGARLEHDPYAVAPAYDLTHFRYLLVHAYQPAVALLYARAVAADTTLVAEQGEWLLFESKYSVVSPATPEAPFPSPAPETVRSRIRRLLAAESPEDQAMLRQALGPQFPKAPTAPEGAP